MGTLTISMVCYRSDIFVLVSATSTAAENIRSTAIFSSQSQMSAVLPVEILVPLSVKHFDTVLSVGSSARYATCFKRVVFFLLSSTDVLSVRSLRF